MAITLSSRPALVQHHQECDRIVWIGGSLLYASVGVRCVCSVVLSFVRGVFCANFVFVFSCTRVSYNFRCTTTVGSPAGGRPWSRDREHRGSDAALHGNDADPRPSGRSIRDPAELPGCGVLPQGTVIYVCVLMSESLTSIEPQKRGL